jgi:putative MATE family efflux protein
VSARPAPDTPGAARPDLPGPLPGGERPLGIWALAGPTMLSFALQTVVSFASTIIVAWLGSDADPTIGRNAVAGVSIAGQVHFVAFAILAAVTIGTTALVARAVGRGDWREADRVLRVSAVAAVGLAAAMMLAMPFTEAIVAAFGVDAEVVRLGGRYLRILLAFNVPMAIGIVLSSGLRGAGDVRTPLAIGALVNAVSLLGHWLLVFGNWGFPRLETDGAALATGFSFAVGGLVYLVLWQRNELAIERNGWLADLTSEPLRRILRIGMPTAAEQFAFQIGLFLFLRIVAGHGTEPVAAYLIGVRILSFSFVPGLGFSTAASTLVGQHLGAGDVRRATRAGWRATRSAVAVMAVAGLVIIGVAPVVASWFGATGQETVRLTVLFIYVLGAAQPLMAIEYALGGALRGAGDTRFPLFAILTGLFVFRLGGALLVTHVGHGGVVAVWCCLLADYAVKAMLLAWRFASGRWQHVRI